MYRCATRVAWLAAFALPAGETWRRWGALMVEPAAYLDDVVMGACFLIGAALASRPATGPRWLSAAWGCAVGIMSLSLISGIAHMSQPDPSGLSGTTAVAIKMVMMGVAIAGLVGAVKGPDGPGRG